MDFDDTCACTGKTLGRLLQPAIMAALAEEPLHGYLLIQRLGDRVIFKNNPPDPTGVYRYLRSMEDDELVKSQWDLGDSGPAKRLYELTPQGRQCLARWARTLTHYTDAVADVLTAIRQARSRGTTRAS